MPKGSGQFRFKKNVNLGAAAAEDDITYLLPCFVETAEYDVIRSTDDPRCLLVGRTGSGKTALIEYLKDQEEHVIDLKLLNVSLSYVTSTKIIRLLHESNVNLGFMFKFLWKHVFTIELLRERFELKEETYLNNFIDRLVEKMSSNVKTKRMQKYFTEHGESFWIDFDERVKESTLKIEDEIKSNLAAKIPYVDAAISGSHKVTEEQKREIQQYGQAFVNSMQLKELTEVLDLLKEGVIDDKKKRVYLVIDNLDDSWVDDSLRYHLIANLIEVAKEFNRIPSLKVIICLRTDLVERTYRFARSAGFQEEKVRSLMLDVTWDKPSLVQLIDKRVSKMVKDNYTTAPVKFNDIIPDAINIKRKKHGTIDFLFERTMMRPRDVISFFNCCIRSAEGQPRITQQIIFKAEGEYSRERLKSLGDEWNSNYPFINDLILSLFAQHAPRFRVQEICGDKFQESIMRFLENHFDDKSDLIDEATKYAISQDTDAVTLKRYIVTILYRIGFIGVKLSGYEAYEWSYSKSHSRGISPSEIDASTYCQIHKMYWRTLGITEHE